MTESTVKQPGQGVDLHRLIFDLTSRATEVPFDQFVGEVVAKLADFYGASIGRIYLGNSQSPVGAVDRNDAMAGFDAQQNKAVADADARLSFEVRKQNRPLKLSQLQQSSAALGALRTANVGEGYGLPITVHGKAKGALCLYSSSPLKFTKDDLKSLQALGNVLQGTVKQEDGSKRYLEDSRENDKKLKHYKKHLQRIEQILEELRALTMARSIILIERTAEFIAKRGEDLPYDESHLNVLLAGGYESAKRLAGLVGSSDERMVVHEGEEESVLVKEVADRALLAIIYQDHDVPALIAEWANSAADRLAEELSALGEVKLL